MHYLGPKGLSVYDPHRTTASAHPIFSHHWSGNLSRAVTCSLITQFSGKVNCLKTGLAPMVLQIVQASLQISVGKEMGYMKLVVSLWGS